MLSGKANKLSAILCGKILDFWKGAIDKEITIFCGSLASDVIKTTVLEGYTETYQMIWLTPD